MSADIKQPLKSEELKGIDLLPLRKVYEYDLKTEAGKEYKVVSL
jgi:alpha-L-fucosidase 2